MFLFLYSAISVNFRAVVFPQTQVLLVFWFQENFVTLYIYSTDANYSNCFRPLLVDRSRPTKYLCTSLKLRTYLNLRTHVLKFKYANFARSPTTETEYTITSLKVLTAILAPPVTLPSFTRKSYPNGPEAGQQRAAGSLELTQVKLQYRCFALVKLQRSIFAASMEKQLPKLTAD